MVRKAGRIPDEEHRPPSVRRLDEAVHHGGRRVADGPPALHQAERLAPMLRRPALGHQGRAARPLAAHPEPEQDAEGHELPERAGKAAGRREDGIDDHAEHQRARPPEPIGNPAEHQAAGRTGHERDRSEHAARGGRQAERDTHGRQRHREERDVERIEHPAERCREQRPLRLAGALAPPPEQSGPGGRRGDSHAAPTARTSIPLAVEPFLSRRASSCEPGVSPWVQIVATCIGIASPARVTTTPSRAMRTARATTATGSWMTAPGSVRGVSEPSGS